MLFSLTSVFYFPYAQHGGRTNAYTASENTNYYFDINSDGFEEALDRLAQFFINPLMSADTTMREIKAVDSDHMQDIVGLLFKYISLLQQSGVCKMDFR
ncbi:hypothetical protein ACFX11_014496 [Malus domestica]